MSPRTMTTATASPRRPGGHAATLCIPRLPAARADSQPRVPTTVLVAPARADGSVDDAALCALLRRELIRVGAGEQLIIGLEQVHILDAHVLTVLLTAAAVADAHGATLAVRAVTPQLLSRLQEQALGPVADWLRAATVEHGR